MKKNCKLFCLVPKTMKRSLLGYWVGAAGVAFVVFLKSGWREEGRRRERQVVTRITSIGCLCNRGWKGRWWWLVAFNQTTGTRLEELRIDDNFVVGPFEDDTTADLFPPPESHIQERGDPLIRRIFSKSLIKGFRGGEERSLFEHLQVCCSTSTPLLFIWFIFVLSFGVLSCSFVSTIVPIKVFMIRHIVVFIYVIFIGRITTIGRCNSHQHVVVCHGFLWFCWVMSSERGGTSSSWNLSIGSVSAINNMSPVLPCSRRKFLPPLDKKNTCVANVSRSLFLGEETLLKFCFVLFRVSKPRRRRLCFADATSLKGSVDFWFVKTEHIPRCRCINYCTQ